MATIYQEIYQHLSDNGRSTTGNMADELGYETRQVRQACKEMADDGKINGSKSKRIPAYIIDGEYTVITGSKSQLLAIIKEHRSSAHSRMKSKSVKQLQRFIRNNIADDVVGGPKIFEFWV